MPKHIVRLILLIVILGAAILGARAIFIDKSFGIYGHYRADAVAEIAADAPIYQGAASCQPCHREQYAMWSKGVHKVVTCETCHGAGAKHPSTEPPVRATSADPHMHSHIAAGRLDHINLVTPTDTVKLCTLCHEKMPGRPATQRQIEVSRHAPGLQCTVCHNPYSPKLGVVGAPKGAKPGDAAAGQKKAIACIGCHGPEGASVNPIWPNLAGQHGGYLVSALQAYKSKTRPDPLMTEQTKALSKEDISDLAAYFTSLSCKTAPSISPAPVAATAGKAKAKTAGCTVCHGAGSVSPNPAWPSLAGQQETYLVNVLKAYQTRARQNSIMAGLVKGLSDTDIRQLAAYYAGLKCK
jgi:cytochrome c553